MKIDFFTGGPLMTNAYLLEGERGAVLVDAPLGVVEWLEAKGVKPVALWVTHSHFDHILDAARVKRAFGCPLACHPLARALLTDPGLVKRYGFDIDYEAAEPEIEVLEGEPLTSGGVASRILHVPGHSPDSICFYLEKEGLLVGGDVLMAGSHGRCDLPGGDEALLYAGIRKKLYTLPDSVKVLPGHGPATTIGAEKQTNPFIRP